MMTRNAKWCKIIAVVAFATMAAGCGNEMDVSSARASRGRDFRFHTQSIKFSLGYCDNMFLCQLDKNEGKLSSDSLYEVYCSVPEWMDEGATEKLREHVWLAFPDSACSKRKAALMMGRCVFNYKWKNYIHFDGVSAMIYNVAYICSIPRKALTGLRCSDGIFGWALDLRSLAIGFVLAVIGFFVSTILGVICHPFETLANLLVGIYWGDGFEAMKGYAWNTNFFASLWDLVWGAIIYPLWQAVVFWL